MIRINDILETLQGHNPDAETDIVERAYIYSAKVHEGQMRLSGEPYLSHPLEVAGILASMRLDSVCVAAGLLHDVLEDTHATEKDIQEIFGDEVLHIVQGLTKISTLPYSSDQDRQAESIRKMILAMADDLRVILIKLVDRLHNMRTLKYHKEPKQKKIARETLDIYAPIALRLGIYWIKNELEDIAFRVLYPEENAFLASRIRTDDVEREKYIETVRDYIKEKLAENGLKGEVVGRHKHFYSIFQKMKKQNLDLSEVYDIIAFRIILDTVPQCYEALGIIHSMWKPLAKKFKDYIAVPKPNLYQSLHTTVFGPFGERVEIQIRTKEMDRVAKSGVAAHWGYKEGKDSTGRDGKAYAWIQNLVETQEDAETSGEFLENVRLDLFPDEVHVFTPEGAVRSLVRGATPVDFAYLIHTEVGHQCTGAKVNGRMVPLSHVLSTGDIVEIITSSKGRPSADWLNFVKTSKARSRIRQWIKSEEKERSLHLGREMCEKMFRKFRLNFNDVLRSEEMEKLPAAFGFKTVDNLLEHVGYGKITPRQVLQKYMAREEEVLPGDSASFFDKIISKVRKKRPADGVIVNGVDDVLVKFAKCCQPVPGDPIIGFITRGTGVAVHRANCVNMLKESPERRIDVQWAAETTAAYPVEIAIRSHDRIGLLAEIASVISKNGANITSAHTETKDRGLVETHFSLLVKGVEQLDSLIAAIKKLKAVSDVKRLGMCSSGEE
ncbi:MAG: bifunctional (p)ppGpp synthetase/guanosine-3',5'-bis(diphosphate) 3'-pyrophosphohydrolase [Thermodesulfobacteriota bacterium]|nr:bifunctional (p)ppGpp synthetase/guanosine-3',5'-bis(diphosphate) 3'-pyrophosphohydrolase [Thermodesulfobacteriota bacterium]